MELTIVGCAGSFPGPDSPASCYLIEADGFRLLLDLGNGALGALQRYASLDGIDAICLSHQHADHCLDMCSYSVARTFHPDGAMPPIPVYAPARTAERLSRALGLEPGSSMTDAFDFMTLAPGTIEIGPLRVTAAHMNHPVETFGFRLEHSGGSLAYSADTGPADALVTLARGADVLLCEASFLDGPGLPGGLHLTGRQAGEHAARAGAGQLVLTHLVSWNDRDRSRAEAAAAFSGPLSLAVSGQVVPVS
ncbi:MAG: MBL fold metallo-hydrolase [Streptosporangiaceae bacterium]